MILIHLRLSLSIAKEAILCLATYRIMIKSGHKTFLKGIVSRDFGTLFSISLDRFEGPDQVYFYFNDVFMFKFLKNYATAVKILSSKES
jgi:hypothetical protein